MDFGSIIATAAPIVTSIIGGAVSAGDRSTAREASDRAYAELMAIGLPPDLSKQLILREFKQVGMLDPELEQHIALGESKVAQIKTNKELAKQQMQSLAALKDISRGGLRPEDRAALNEIREQERADTQARLASIQQNMQARGMGGSGAELASQLSAAQAGANRTSRESDQLAALASQRALDAIMKGGSLAGDIRAQEFGEEKTRASAEDEFQRFNVANKQAIQQRNVGSKNRAQEYNVKTAQDLADMNVSQANKELQRQNEAKRTYWKDLAERAGLRSSAETRRSEDFRRRAGDTATTYAGYGSQIAGIAKGAGDYFKQDESVPDYTKSFVDSAKKTLGDSRWEDDEPAQDINSWSNYDPSKLPS